MFSPATGEHSDAHVYRVIYLCIYTLSESHHACRHRQTRRKMTLTVSFVRSGTDLISLLVMLLFLLFLGVLFKKHNGSIVSNEIDMKFDRNVLQANSHRLTESDLTSHFQDGGHDVISLSKVLLLPPGQSTRSVRQRLCSNVRQFLIYSTFVLVELQ